MTHVQPHFHGSDLEKIEAAYGIKKETIINYSSNVNPLGLSPRITTYLPKKIELIASYPDREYTSLRNAIGAYVGVDASNVLVGNGSTELISLCIKATQPKKALILGPTYSEYEKEIELVGGHSAYYPLLEIHDFKLDLKAFVAALSEDMDLLVLCNPNNPTSTAIGNVDLAHIVVACQQKGIFVLIDETYVEFSEHLDAVTAVHLAESFDNLMVIRGVSKFFAAPGLRLGYGICSSKIHVAKVNRLKNPWTINSLAAFAGELMLGDVDYIKSTRAYMTKERTKVVDEMSTWRGVQIYQPVANFILVKICHKGITAHDLFEKMLEKHLMIRDASSFEFLDERFFRFCFLKSEDNDALLKALGGILK